MNKSNISRSKEFIEKERKAREGLRLSVERELVGDMIRLLDEKLYCDVTFVIENDDFPAHVAILCARAPAFSQKFLPQLLTPTAVQSCIYIQDLKPEEFLGFLRSVYTEDKVLDYSANEYPWAVKVSWSYPKDVIQHEQHEICNGLEDSIEEKTSDTSTEEKLTCYQQVETSENDSQILTACTFNGNELQESESCEEIKDQDCENVVLECQSLEPGARTKEPKNKGSLNEEEVSLVEMKACCKIGEDLLTLVNDCKTSDVTFLLNNTERIKAHRSILCTRSSYFSAMLYGGWVEGQATEIPLHGIHSTRAFLAVLYYLYGGITRLPLEIADICEVLRLSDMYGLEGLKEVVSCQLRIEKCHLFHKPCSECVAGVVDCLDVSDLFQLSDLKSQSMRWIAKYFDRVYGTKNFASLSKSLQDETLACIRSTMSVTNVLDLFSRGEKLTSGIPRIKWAEPVLPLVSSHVDSCLSFIASNFPRIANQQAFLDMLKGVGWSTPLLEKIFATVGKHLTVNNCCKQLKEAMRLQSILNADVAEEEALKRQFSEESHKLVDSLRSRCQEFIVSNLHRVSHTEGWKHLGPKTQNEVRKTKGGLFVDIGLPSQTNMPRKRPPSGKRSTKTPSSLKQPATMSTSRGRPHGSDSVDGTQRSVQGTAASATGLSSRRRPQGSAETSRRSVQDTTVNRTAASASGLSSRSRSRGSAERTRRSVQDTTLNMTAAATTGMSFRSRPQGSAERTRRSVQDTTLNRTAAATTGMSSRSRPRGSAERTRRSVQDTTLDRTSDTSSVQSSRGRPQSSAGTSHSTSKTVQDTTSSSSSAATSGLAPRSRPKNSLCSAEKTRRCVQNATSSRGLPSFTSRTMKGTEGKNASMTSLSQNLSKQESSKRYSRSADVSASSSMSASTSYKKRPSSASKEAVSSTTTSGLPHGISRSYSDFNRAKLVDVSGRKYLSDPSISESSKPKTNSGRNSGRLQTNEPNTNSNVIKADISASRIKLARESFVGPVRQAQRGKLQANVRDKKIKTQEVSVNSNNKDSSSSGEPARQVQASSTKTPLPAQSIPTSQTSRILNETMTIGTALELATSSEVTSVDASRANEMSPRQDDMLNEAVEALSLLDDKIVLNETTEVPSVQENDGIPLNGTAEASSVQENDGIPLNGTEASSVQENDGIPLNGTEAPSVQENDGIPMNETAEASSVQENDGIPINGTAEASSVQENDGIPMNGTEASSVQENDGIPINGTAEASSVQENDGIPMNGTEASSVQENDGIPMNETEASSVQENDGIPLNGTEASSVQENDGIPLNGAEASSVQENDGIPLNGTAEASSVQESDGISLNGAEASSVQENDGIPLNGTEASSVQENDGIPLNGAEASSVQENDGIPLNGTAEASSVQESDGISLNGAEASSVQENDGIPLNGTEASSVQENDGIPLKGTAEASSVQESDGISLNGAEASSVQENDGIPLKGTAD